MVGKNYLKENQIKYTHHYKQKKKRQQAYLKYFLVKKNFTHCDQLMHKEVWQLMFNTNSIVP
jgi:radical SAM superfamily enzyme